MAIEDYEQQYDVYNQALQQYERQAQSTIAESRPASGSGAGAVSNNAAAPPTLPTAPSPALDASSSYSSISEPKPPSIPFTVQQFLHKPLRHAPQTRESTHAPYRVSVVASKKSISKLAVYRTLCRRKFYQAIENVFRGRAQQGFDYLILAGADSLHTPQSRLEQLLIDALEDPRLHGGSGRGRGMARRSMASSSSSSSSSSSLPAQKKKSEEASGNEAEKKQRHIESDIIDKPFVAQMKRVGGVAASAVAAVHASHHKPREDARADVNQQPEGGGGEEEQDQGGRSSSSSSPSSSPSSPKLRYRDDKKPPFKRFWKHGLPDPLPRKVFREDYLNLYAVGNWGKDDPDSPEHRRAVALRQRQGMWLHRRRLVNRENQRKAVEVAKEREKVLTQHRGVVRSLIEKHFADRS
ncbi:hypothetical protein DFQ27_008793 [Actinomortierella ambigua]|uniref:Uncharacterized protein n=1 Tax=Actinomortierella ambigua TaxID=1343610 RepID=A0A9P6PRU4_9FUNG|nr:hypothetical protein DFQ27_008793 [Actinomortierella ambigua]